MTPDMIMLIVQGLIKYGPAAGKAIYDLFQKPAPTAADWEELFRITEKSYEQYVPGTQLPKP